MGSSQKKTKQVKYRLICTAQEHLTTYNEEVNKEVESACKQKEKFSPHLSCTEHTWDTDNKMCPYIKIRKVG